MGPALFCGPTFIFSGCAHPNPGVMKNMESIWSRTARIREHPPLQGDLNVQVAVLGGGLAGILTAYRLREQGADVAVLEASRVGSGQTKGTTAKITSQHSLIYARLIRELGAEKARQYADANQRAIGEYRRLIEHLGIACQFEQRPAYLYSTLAEDAAALQEETRAARELGIDGAFTEATELPFPVAGAVRFDGQAQFHPLAFLSAVSAGLKIFEHTAAVTVDGNRISTDRGSVTAEKIVFATHFPFLNKPGYYFARMHQERSYVLALEHVPPLHGMYLGIGESGLSFRSWGDTLLLGGGGHRTGENRTGGSYDLLRRAAAEFFPGGTEAAHWSAQDCMPLDSVPYIGQYSSSTPDWYVADIINVFPFNNALCVKEVTGQQILDALEMAARNCPSENGGFLQVSGLKYTIDTTIPSTVTVNDKGEFTGVRCAPSQGRVCGRHFQGGRRHGHHRGRGGAGPCQDLHAGQP